MDTLYLHLSAYIHLSMSCLVIFCSSLILAGSTVQIVTENTYPWSYFDENNSELKGFSTALIIAVMKDASMSFEITVLSWARTHNHAKNNAANLRQTK